jgi:predicted  nucleic acid-binding Zn-ribbon protein
MSIEVIVGISATVFIALVGIIIASIKGRQDSADRHIEKAEEESSKALREHVRDDSIVHERVATLEADMATVKTEVSKLRDMRHEIMSHVSEALASWYQRVVEMIRK